MLTLTFSATQTFAAELPGTAADHYASAKKAFRNGDYQVAAAAYRAADEAGFDDPALFYNLGVALYKLGQYPQAEAAFARAIKLRLITIL